MVAVNGQDDWNVAGPAASVGPGKKRPAAYGAGLLRPFFGVLIGRDRYEPAKYYMRGARTGFVAARRNEGGKTRNEWSKTSPLAGKNLPRCLPHLTACPVFRGPDVQSRSWPALGRPFRLGIAGGAPPSLIGPVHRVCGDDGPALLPRSRRAVLAARALPRRGPGDRAEP